VRLRRAAEASTSDMFSQLVWQPAGRRSGTRHGPKGFETKPERMSITQGV
jgi:hypothetical protein